jgi:hypothetical protein
VMKFTAVKLTAWKMRTMQLQNQKEGKEAVTTTSDFNSSSEQYSEHIPLLCGMFLF